MIDQRQMATNWLACRQRAEVMSDDDTRIDAGNVRGRGGREKQQQR
jgi:hypothetical protein